MADCYMTEIRKNENPLTNCCSDLRTLPSSPQLLDYAKKGNKAGIRKRLVEGAKLCGSPDCPQVLSFPLIQITLSCPPHRSQNTIAVLVLIGGD